MNVGKEIFIPDDLSVVRPLLIALHGGGQDSASQIDLWRSVASREKIIILAPNSLKPPFIEATWFTPDNGQSLVNKINEVLGLYPVDRNRIYCFGHSVGATKALDWGFHNRHCFAAVALHSPMQASGIYHFKPEPGTRSLPLSVWAGAESSDSNWHCASTLIYAYKEHPNFSIALTVLPNHKHNDIYTRPGITDEIWSFLQQHTLQK
jgi:poly(3-hydroxybutyrate) depolymerase